jgi:acyl-homoserine-lactone acylase
MTAARPLGERVLIRRDTFGIPHIFAETDEAAGFGLGYAQAEDQLEILARRLLEARGEAARIFGPAALEKDIAMQRLDNLGEARRQLGHLGGRFRGVLEGFAGGVNLYVQQHRQDLPDWVPEFTAADVLANTRSGAAESVGNAAMVRALSAKYPSSIGLADDRRPGVEEGDAPGSNALALSGSRTTSGKTILLGNPHLSWSSRYWEAHIIVPGRLNFYGSTLVGLPWLRAGFNESLGYVQTNNAPDLSDVYSLPLDPSRPDAYRFEGRSRPLVRKDVEVEVKQPDGTLRSEHRTFWSSHLGPIVYRSRDRVFAYRSVAFDAWRQFEGFYELSHARNLKQYRSTLGRLMNPTSNFTYADAAGNVLYQWTARLPKRVADGTSYELDVPGDTRKYVWTKYHRLADLPHMLNPPGGYIQNANNPPWYVSTRDPIDEAQFPPYVERGELALRPQLALQMLGSRERFSPDDVVDLKFTTRMLLADRVKPALIQAARAVVSPSPDLARAVELLDAWDNRVAATSVGAILFQRFWDTYRTAVKQPYAVLWDPMRPADTPSGLGDPARAVAMLDEAVRWTRSSFESEAVAWGDVHRYRFAGLDLPGDGASGTYGVYRVQQFDMAPGGKRIAGQRGASSDLAGFGDAWILLVHFTRPVQAFSVLAYGQNANPASPHSRDQIRIFSDHRLRPIWFTQADITAHQEREYRPVDVPIMPPPVVRQQPAVLVVFETELGAITMEVDVAHAPITGQNFLRYVDGKFYDGGVVNRAVRPDNTTRHDVEIQVIQFQFDPARRREQFPPIVMERTNVTGLKHVNGSLSMARSSPDSATASFSIVIGDQPEMDFGGKRNADGQGFAVFGQVVEGMDIVKKIQASHTGTAGAYRSETLDPPIEVLRAYRK